jgi:hypothetical protein
LKNNFWTWMTPVGLALCLALQVSLAVAQPAVQGMNELPIHDAARMGTQVEVEKLLKASAENRDARTPLGATPLHYAAMNQDMGPLKALLDVLSLARKVRADEAAGEISLWILKGCKPGRAC